MMGGDFQTPHLGKVRVVAFTGRESDAPLGIWGAIAEQLGKKELCTHFTGPCPDLNSRVKIMKKDREADI